MIAPALKNNVIFKYIQSTVLGIMSIKTDVDFTKIKGHVDTYATTLSK